MKKNYMKPETTVLDIVANRCILQTSSISIVDEEYNDEFDVKEEDLTDENLYRILIGWN